MAFYRPHRKLEGNEKLHGLFQSDYQVSIGPAQETTNLGILRVGLILVLTEA